MWAAFGLGSLDFSFLVCMVFFFGTSVVARSCRFAHFKKTNKSGLNTIIEENAVPFELWVNGESLQGLANGQRPEAPLTLTYIPGATPEELFAQCDADRKACFILRRARAAQYR